MNNKEKIEKIRQLLNEYCMDCDIDEYSNTYEKCDDYLISRTGITQKEFDDLTERAMQECGLLKDSEDAEND